MVGLRRHVIRAGQCEVIASGEASQSFGIGTDFDHHQCDRSQGRLEAHDERCSGMKSFLIPIGGSDTDEPLFASALAAAGPFASHMNFFHVHIGPGQAAANEPHAAFAKGPALSSALKDLDPKAQIRSTLAAQRFHEFCTRSGVAICDAPGLTKGVTARRSNRAGSRSSTSTTRSVPRMAANNSRPLRHQTASRCSRRRPGRLASSRHARQARARVTERSCLRQRQKRILGLRAGVAGHCMSGAS
jgi:hypothetical protein